MTNDAVTVAGNASNSLFDISPDGKWIVYTVLRNGARQLFLRSIESFEGKLISGTDGAVSPFFSPDSQWIALGSGKDLKRVPISGGAPTTVCSCATTVVSGTWTSDNRIAFIPEWNLGIWNVSADGGMPELLLNTDEGKDLIAYEQLEPLPDARGILLTVVSGQTMSANDAQIAILEAGATEPRILFRGGFHATYVPSGHLIYSRGDALLSVPFDLSRLAVTGTPVTVVEGVEKGLYDYTRYSVSENGTLIYQPTSGIQGGRRVVMVDRRGNVQPVTERRGLPAEFSVSPDGKRIAARLVAANDDIWTYDAATGAPLRLTTEPFDETNPQWTPDGVRIAFGTRTGKLFWQPADGSGPREQLSQGEYPRQMGSISPDGKLLAFVEVHPTRRGEIWMLSLDADRKAQAIVATDANETRPRFSPNGRWLADVG